MPSIALETGVSNEDSIRWIDTVATPIVILDHAKNVVGWNRLAAESTRIPRQDIMHRSISSFLQLKSAERLTMATREIETGGRDSTICNLSFSSYERRQFRVKIAAKQDSASGEVSGMVCFIMYHIDKNEPMVYQNSPISPTELASPTESSNPGLSIIQDAGNDSSVECNGLAFELRQLIDTANLPIFGVDNVGRIKEWNNMMAQITGYSKKEALERNFVESFIKPSLHDSTRGMLDTALQERGNYIQKVEVQIKNGDFRSFIVNATTRRNADKRIVGVVFFARDVTETYQNDDRDLESVVKELGQVIDNANAPIFGVDCAGHVNEWNIKTAEIMGVTKEGALECALVERFVTTPMRVSFREVLDNALQGRRTSNHQVDFQTSLNEIRPLLVNVAPRKDAENKIIGVVCVAQDVTQVLHQDRSVTGMAAELRQLIDTANAPIFGIDIDGNVNEWNDRTADIMGYSKEEAFNEALVEKFVVKRMNDRVQEILAHALAGKNTPNYEIEFISKSGDPIFLLVNATTRRDPQNEVVGGKSALMLASTTCNKLEKVTLTSFLL